MQESHFNILVSAACVLYGIYLWSGLLLLLLPFLCPFLVNQNTIIITSLRGMTVSWVTSVWCLALANILHLFAFRGVQEGLIFLCWSVFACVAIEEVGPDSAVLRYGFIFGNYQFTEALGPKLTARLPVLVPILWQCFTYPCLVLARRVSINIRGGLGATIGGSAVLSEAILFCTFLVGFDLVSEPVAVSQGHTMWEHVAWVGGLDTYAPHKPDWSFREQQSYNDALFRGARFFANIPILNFVGWTLMGLVIYFGNTTTRLSFV